MATGAVKVEGLRELRRKLRRAGENIQPALQAELKTIAQPVADEAKRVARAKGLHDSGRLVERIRPQLLGGVRVAVADIAKRRGYNYPREYEHGPRQRPFPAPRAARQTRPGRERRGQADRQGSEKGGPAMSEPRHRGRIRPGQINVNGKSYDFDVSELELDEVADVEEAIGVPMGDWAARSMRATIGFIWAIVRRTDPDFTLEDARKLKFGSTPRQRRRRRPG